VKKLKELRVASIEFLKGGYMQDFRKLVVWQKAHELTMQLYIETKKFPKDELYGITAQLRRAATSIAANIVEGAGRKTKTEFARFLTIALGSANEVEYFLMLSEDLDYMSSEVHNTLYEKLVEIRKMLLSLSKRISAINS
jgi:four helix bundle protein